MQIFFEGDRVTGIFTLEVSRWRSVAECQCLSSILDRAEDRL